MKPVEINITEQSITFCDKEPASKFKGSVMLNINKDKSNIGVERKHTSEKQLHKQYAQLEKAIRRIHAGKSNYLIMEDDDSKIKTIPKNKILGATVNLKKVVYTVKA